MRSTLFVVLSAAGLVAGAQNYTITPSSVSLSTRAAWCTGEQNTCSTLCASTPKANTCDPTTLNYTCLCSNGSAPGLEYYTQTMPTYICNQAYADCIAANANDATAQKNCKTTIQDNCGTLDPTKADVSSGTTTSAAASSAAATSSAASSRTASASATAATTSSSSGAIPTALVHLGNGAAVVAAGVLAYML